MKRILSLLLAVALVCSLLPGVFAEDGVYQVGDKQNGFTVMDVREFALLGADVITLEHDKTGALVMLLLNEDTNRAFDITFRTVAEDNRGTPHVFEHATLGGSEKYPSKALFFSLSYQTYNTYMNAHTYPIMTTYPVASLSEEQLLKLADYYLDSCFYPSIMTDESIFREEAWRYELTDADAPLTLNGTVYNEMKGALTLSSAASFNYYRTLMPGSVQGNVFGGDPEAIPDMSWQSLKDYHDTYYHPSNSLTCVYGKLENPAAFLALLDSVFSGFEKKDVSGLFTNSGYEPITEAQEAVYAYPVEEGADTANGSEVYYGFRCDNASMEELYAFDLFTSLAYSDSSVFMQRMKEQLPSAAVSCYVDYGTVPSVVFSASGLNTEDAALFRQIVDESMAEIARNGFPAEQAEAMEAAYKLDILLMPETSNVGVNVVPEIAYFWAAADSLYGYMDSIDRMDYVTQYAADGTFCRLAEEYLVNNPIRALAVTEPVPGLKEQNEAALAQSLAEKKAAMTEEEISAIVASTNAPEAEEVDTDAMVAELNAVTVDTLPEEYRIFDIQESRLDHGVRSFFVPAAADGMGKTMLCIDISSLPQEQLHWLMLYIDLLGELDTTAYSQAELDTLLTRYTNDLNLGVIMPLDDSEAGYTPYLQVSFNALDEDLLPAYELLAELLFYSDITNESRLKGAVSNLRVSAKQQINAEGFAVLIRHLFGSTDEDMACYDYLTGLPYYEFLCQVESQLALEPWPVVDQLGQTRSELYSMGHGAISGYVGSEAGREANETAVDALLKQMGFEERQRQDYSFAPAGASEGWILETNTNYNEAFVSWEELGLEKYTADWDVVCALVNDRYLMPELRDARGAYDAYLGCNEYGLYAYTYRDPGVKESFEVFSRLGEMLLADTGITQQILDGYILSSYSYYAMPNGELTDGFAALSNLLNRHPQEEKLEKMQAVKSVTVDRIPEYAAVLSRLMEKGVYATVSSASVINANAALYEKTVNPFGAVDASQLKLTDVDEAHPYFAEIRTAFEGGLMEAAEGTFRPEDGLTLGEFSAALYALIGGAFDQEEAIATLNAYMILPADPADTPLTRDNAVVYLNNYLLALGMELEEQPLGAYADADQLTENTTSIWAWMIANGLILPREDNTLAPNEPLTRAEYACMLAGIL